MLFVVVLGKVKWYMRSVCVCSYVFRLSGLFLLKMSEWCPMLYAVLGLIHLFKGPQEESRLRKETSL